MDREQKIGNAGRVAGKKEAALKADIQGFFSICLSLGPWDNTSEGQVGLRAAAARVSVSDWELDWMVGNIDTYLPL